MMVSVGGTLSSPGTPSGQTAGGYPGAGPGVRDSNSDSNRSHWPSAVSVSPSLINMFYLLSLTGTILLSLLHYQALGAQWVAT